MTQLLIKPEEKLSLALTYTHIYQRGDDVNLLSGTVSKDANEPFRQNPTTSNNFSLQLNWAISDRFEVGDWLGYTQAQEHGVNREATILNGTLTLFLPIYSQKTAWEVLLAFLPCLPDTMITVRSLKKLHFTWRLYITLK